MHKHWGSFLTHCKTGKILESRKIIWSLCHVHRNKSLSKLHYGNNISNTKKGKMRNNKIEKQETNRRKSKGAPVASKSDALNRENMEYLSYQNWSQSKHQFHHHMCMMHITAHFYRIRANH